MLVLVRHGEAVANAARVLLGRLDSPLTDRGRAQAAALAPALGNVGRLITSPLDRARDSAAALGLGLPVEVDDRWVEVDYGEYEGRPLSAVESSAWERWRSNPASPWPGGESLANVGRRVRQSCEELFAADGTGARSDSDVVVVSHVSPIKAAVAWALGTGDEVVWRLYLGTASVTRVAWGVDAPILLSYNERAQARASRASAGSR
jgi:broad specificity phosphatase PhoE